MFKFLSRFVPRSAVVVLLMLTLAAVAGFAAVSHLVTRYSLNQQARGRKLYAQGLSDLNGKSPDRAIQELQAALMCDRGNTQYQLTLGRALRDAGRLDEAQSYLESLWQDEPEDGTINLALARVATRRGSVDDAMRYYHNAMYGVWLSDADENRRKARIELIEFLLQKNAKVQARSELLALAAFLPSNPDLELRVAELLAQAQDYPDALAEYEKVLRRERNDGAALAGAGEAAYRAGRYRTALRYLQEAVKVDQQDSSSRKLLTSANMILQTDPFVHPISDAERDRRIAAAFATAGDRLNACAKEKGERLSSAAPESSPSSLAQLYARWLAARPDLRRLRFAAETDLPDVIMDLVFQIEQETAIECGEPQGADEALLLISRNREAADR